MIPFFLLILIGSASLAQTKNVDIIDLEKVDLDQRQRNFKKMKRSKEQETKIENINETKRTYQFSSFGRDNPFQEPISNQVTQSEKETVLSTLQEYTLDQLHLKGVWITSKGITKAIIMTPEKKGVVVKKGDAIATGRVLDITKTKVVVRLYTLNEDGSRDFRDEELLIDPAGMPPKK